MSRFLFFAVAVLVCSTTTASAQSAVPVVSGEWRNFGGNYKNHKYSPLDQIDRNNFTDLEVAWQWEPEIQNKAVTANPSIYPGEFKTIPLMVDGIVYVATALSQVAAIDAGSGETVWDYDPKSYEAGRPANIGWQHRGVSYWSDGDEARIFIATHDRKLIALDPKTGGLFEDFGEGGIVDLVPSLERKVDIDQITHSSPVGICRDTVIVGSIVFDGPRQKRAPPGFVRGFDPRSGELKWTFHTIPQRGEEGIETWENRSWRYTGACNVWSMFATDEDLGYVYLPTGTPTNDMYGGHRLGDNLFAESIVCLDADTGERAWHFQAIHHGLWDYDFPTAGCLADVTIDGKPRKIIAQTSKQGFCYVLDRMTGKPIWPIEERPVPASNVPGERASPTQPHPTKPAAYDRQGFIDENLIDFTPELRQEALDRIGDWPRGPLFTPPTLKGTIGIPAAGGVSNWQGAALDPETGLFYVPSATSVGMFQVSQPDRARSDLDYATAWFTPGPHSKGIQGLPFTKPPYSRVTAINLNTGEHQWMTPHGDGPRNHPLLKDLNLGPLGEPRGNGGPLVTNTLLFVYQGRSSEGPRMSVFDKATGEILGAVPLPDRPLGNPVTYMHDGKQHILVSMGGGLLMGDLIGATRTKPSKVIALTLP